MFRKPFWLMLLCILLLLTILAACVKTTEIVTLPPPPTATQVPPTKTPLKPTATQVPPTKTLPHPTDTPAMPTQTQVLWSGNNHLYQVVRVPGGISWEDANQSAQALGGHLVTITSASENDFVFSIASSLVYQHGFFLGGYQLPGSPEPNGGWVWVTGEPWDYTNWDEGEPNNNDIGSGLTEERLHFHWENDSGWNDLPASDGSPRGYIVEYE